MIMCVYVIKLPMVGTDEQFELCRCEDASKVAAVVEALLRAKGVTPGMIFIHAQIIEQ